MKAQRSAIAAWLMKINLACAFLSGVALLLMMIAGAADVIGTNLDLGGLRASPIPAAFEFMATMMVVNVFLAMSLAQARRNHIRVEVLVNRLPKRLQKAADFVQYVLGVVFFGLIAWFAWPAAVHSFSVGEYAPGLINFPVWPARFILAFGATLMSTQCVFDVIGVFSERYQSTDLAHHAETPLS
ncbi:MAG: TRAP transporter small permease subunit [Acidiferrobacterales bacterium]